MNELVELCPICIENPAENYTECNHSYCIGCLCRISRCAMCRNDLQRSKICIQIKEKVRLIYLNIIPLIFNNSEDFDRMVRTTISINGDLISRLHLSVTLPELNEINHYTHPPERLNSISRRIYSRNRLIRSIN